MSMNRRIARTSVVRARRMSTCMRSRVFTLVRRGDPHLLHGVVRGRYGDHVTQVAILGLGLIGGSLLRRLGSAYDVRGYDPDTATRATVAAAGFQATATVA